MINVLKFYLLRTLSRSRPLATNCPPRATFIIRHNLTKFIFLHTITSDKSHYENVPFEIPESWVWTTIDELLINRDSERIPLSSAVRKKQSNKVYDYYGAAGVIDKVEGYLFNERLLLIGEDGANLLSRSKDNAFFADGKYWVNNHAHVLDCSYKPILTYVAYLINSISLEPYVTGTAQPKLSQDNLNKIPISLPPIEEQKRIVAEIKKWFAVINEIENDTSELESYIKLSKSKILDLAISGKLVPQDPDDEPAIELLKRINPDFEPCDNSHYENLPFEIPSNWVWASHNDILEISGGAQPPKSEFSEVMKPGYIRLYQIRDYGEKPIPIYIPLSTASKTTVKGDILLARYGGSLGKVFIAEDGAYNVAMAKVIFCYPEILNRKFVYYYYSSSIYQNKLRSISRTAQAGFNSGDFEDMYFPLPPLNEQERIVDAISSIWEMIDMITAEL